MIALSAAATPGFIGPARPKEDLIREADQIELSKERTPLRTPENQELLLKIIDANFRASTGRNIQMQKTEDGWAVTFSAKRQEIFNEFVSGLRHTLNDIPAADLTPDTLLYGEEGLEHWSEMAVLGVSDHELSHILYTDFRELLYAQKRLAARGDTPALFMQIHNAFEDPRINNLKSFDSPASRERLQSLYREHQAFEVSHAKTPRIHQYGFTAHHYWVHGTPSPFITDPEVNRIFEKTKPFIDEFFYERDGAKATRIFEEKIWPKLASLKKQLLDETANELAKQFGKKPGRSLKDRILGREKSDADKIADALGKELRRRLQENGDKELAPELQDAVKKALDKLPKDLKGELEKAAKEAMEENVRKELAKKPAGAWETKKDQDGNPVLVPKCIPGDAQSKNASKESAPKDRNDQSKNGGAHLKDLQAKMKELGFSADERQLYQEFLEVQKNCAGIPAALIRALEAVLPKEFENKLEGTARHGKRLSATKLAQRIPVGRMDIFERSNLVESGMPRIDVVLLVDNSGSMNLERSEAARIISVALSQALTKFGIYLSIYSFDNSVHVIKTANTPLLPGAAAELMRNSKGDGGGTALGEALQKAEGELLRAKALNPDHLGVIFAITDGEPTVGLQGEELGRYIESLKRRFAVLGLLMSEDPRVIQALTATFGEQNRALAASKHEVASAVARGLSIAVRKFTDKRSNV